ncbi:type II toxin-antitoxin system VapB family antitoxin [Vreelandella nanhaiensis]|uniref:Type II toxin-antitoxin system VapB family antitoxin n=1 Tax=Vreelandella nanhaiensis TaxID=1258546 RepID=A0A433KQH7_9GAMM|nr:type II toxin-antitoxin system VapB family antitoxin [Halomonas nanhaiensis]RUR31812.1 type II toxin-antitoxin system VapB family antitoxin [Halomonas nanhaiensis]
MKITITIDDVLYAEALRIAELDEPSKLFEEALKTYLRVQAARRLAVMGGTAPDMPDISRCRDASRKDKP